MIWTSVGGSAWITSTSQFLINWLLRQFTSACKMDRTSNPRTRTCRLVDFPDPWCRRVQLRVIYPVHQNPTSLQRDESHANTSPYRTFPTSKKHWIIQRTLPPPTATGSNTLVIRRGPAPTASILKTSQVTIQPPERKDTVRSSRQPLQYRKAGSLVFWFAFG